MSPPREEFFDLVNGLTKSLEGLNIKVSIAGLGSRRDNTHGDQIFLFGQIDRFIDVF